MAAEVFNRYENKYFISEIVLHRILSEIEQHMELDKFNRGNQPYSISNIYFDTADDLLIRTSLAKPEYKEKLRLRTYGVPEPDDTAFLEMKRKCGGLVNKRRTGIPLRKGYRFVSDNEIMNLSMGTALKDISSRITSPQDTNFHITNPQVVREISCMIHRYGGLEPKVFIAYDRLAWHSKSDLGLRVSFDTNIRSRRNDLRLEKGNHGSLLIAKGIWLMEIKTEKAVPLWLAELLSREGVYKSSFSKYGFEYKKFSANVQYNHTGTNHFHVYGGLRS